MMIEVRLPKCLLILTESEFLSLLAHDPTLWGQAIARGKALKRARRRAARAMKTMNDVNTARVDAPADSEGGNRNGEKV